MIMAIQKERIRDMIAVNGANTGNINPSAVKTNVKMKLNTMPNTVSMIPPMIKGITPSSALILPMKLMLLFHLFMPCFL